MSVPAYGLSSSSVPTALTTECADEAVTIDLRAVKFCDPLGLVRIAALADDFARRGSTVRCLPPEQADTSAYLSRMHLDQILPPSVDCQLPGVREHDRRDVLIELSSYTQTWDTDLEDRLSRILQPNDAGIPPIPESVSLGIQELVANATEHSAAPGGAFLAAQRFPQRRCCVVAVGDVGIGIPAALRRDDVPRPADAIAHALVRGVSGTGDPQRGQGLCEIATEAAAENASGLLEIWSDSGYVQARRVSDAWEPTVRRAEAQTRGTWVRLTLQT